jgi:type I pantothenate kinase
VSSSRYLSFSRAEWAKLRAATPLPLTENDLATLRGINERISLDEVSEVYLPLSRLLNLYVTASQSLHAVSDTFLGNPASHTPYVVAIAGSVAVGKSTTARVLQALLARWPAHPNVALVTTDGFLLPNKQLADKGILDRKGFPESYDLRRLVEFMARVKSGEPSVRAPLYSHLIYDIVSGEEQVVERPEILILEGLNVLSTGVRPDGVPPRTFVSDYVDFSIYVDADEAHVETWYIERFFALCEGRFKDPSSYFHRYANLTREEARQTAARIWREINALNLRENILPTRERAHLILEKAADHTVKSIRLRR